MSAEVIEFRPRPQYRPWWWWLALTASPFAAWVVYRALAGWPSPTSWFQRIAG